MKHMKTEKEIYFKNQKEVLELKNVITENKTPVNGLNSSIKKNTQQNKGSVD